jgi:ABC-type transport system involved in cytochrome bd biosynthesis fused ATPase/permease subunit
LKYGRLLKGPVMLTPKEFNQTVNGDGIGFKTTEAKQMMRIPLQAEAQHIELMGDTGAGKTTLIMQILRQIQGRGTRPSSTTRPASSFNASILRSVATLY